MHNIHQTKCTTNIFDHHSWKHDSTQIVITAIIKCLGEKYFWPVLKMFCSVYYQLQVHSKYFRLTVRLESIIPWRSLVTTIYTCCTSIIHLSENTNHAKFAIFFIIGKYKAACYATLVLMFWHKIKHNISQTS